MSKNTIGLPAESPEAIAERLLPCPYENPCADYGKPPCTACAARPAVIAFIQARDKQLAAALQAERERALEEAAYAIEHISKPAAAAIRILRALAKKGGGE